MGKMKELINVDWQRDFSKEKLTKLVSDSEYYPSWQWDAGAISGYVEEVKEIPPKEENGGKPKRIIIVRDQDSELWTVWEAAALRHLFDKVGVGDKVIIEPGDMVETDRGYKMRTFEVYHDQS